MKKTILALFMCMFLIGLVSPSQVSIGTFKLNTDINLFQICSNCNQINISTVTYPNSTIALSGVVMTSTDNYYYNYTLDSSLVTEEGVYTVNGYDNAGEVFAYDFTITQNGKEKAGSLVIALFSVIFIFICFEMLGLLLWTILHFIELNIDAKDLILNVSSYFALFAFYILETRLMGDSFLDSFTLFLVEMGAVTTIIIPIIGFVVSYIKQNTTKGDQNK